MHRRIPHPTPNLLGSGWLQVQDLPESPHKHVKMLLALTMLASAAILQTKPPPLAASDGVHSFTYDSVQRRLPLIVEAVLENNPEYPQPLVESLRALAAEIGAGCSLKPLQAAPDTWVSELEPVLAASQTWFTAPWFLVENYFYKRILELTIPVMGEAADPFAAQKAASLSAASGAFQRMLDAELDSTDSLEPLVATSLWGNLADLSVSAGAVLVSPEAASGGGGGQGESMILADETGALCSALEAARAGEVLLVLDNCGLELVSDLLLVDGLLRCGQSKVTLHVKDSPVFVSDVMASDLEPTLVWLEEEAARGKELAARLRAALTDGRLSIESPPFYTSSLPFWEMPESLHERLGRADVVITKGDANYRRLLGDLHWAHDASFQDLMSYWPTSLAALRTCKSGVLVGTVRDVEAAAAAAHPGNWLTGGLYGVVQFRAA